MKISLMCLLLFLICETSFARKGESGVSLLVSENQPRDLRFSWDSSSYTLDVGVNISNQFGIYFGSRSWKDGFYIGGGPIAYTHVGLYGVIGYEAQFSALTLITEFWAVVGNNHVSSALGQIGIGFVW